jgi:hypothetical protein
MSKMGNFIVAIEEALFDGATAEEVAAEFGVPVAMIEQHIAELEENYIEPDIDTYTEYQDLYGGDDQFETCNFVEDF